LAHFHGWLVRGQSDCEKAKSGMNFPASGGHVSAILNEGINET
jgi:hypothetical protein